MTKVLQATTIFELAVLKACLLYTTCPEAQFFKSKVQNIISPAMFSSKPLWVISSAILLWYKKFPESPTKDAFDDFLLDWIRFNQPSEQDSFEDIYRPIMKSIWSQEIIWEQMIAKVLIYAEQKLIMDSIVKAIDAIKKTPLDYTKEESPLAELAHNIARDLSRVDDIRKDESQSVSIGINEEINEDDVLDLCNTSINNDADIRLTDTNFGILKPFINNGLYRRELSCVMAPPGSFKTGFLTAIGADALRDGKHVLHISLENKASYVLQGYLRNEIQDNITKDNLNLIDKAKFPYLKNLCIQQFASGSCTIPMIDDLIIAVKRDRGWTPDLIIVDYPEIMHRGSKMIPIHEWLPSMFVQLRGIAFKYHAHVATANQINRQGKQKNAAGQEDTAGAFAINNHCDQIFILQSTDKEVQQNQLRLYVAKSRNAADKRTILCEVNFQNKTLRTLELTDDEEIEEGTNNYRELRKKKNNGDFTPPDIKFDPVIISNEI